MDSSEIGPMMARVIIDCISSGGERIMGNIFYFGPKDMPRGSKWCAGVQ
jgi:hypothetical protein